MKNVILNSQILGVGIDSVEIERIKPFISFDKKQLNRIFSDQELNYCLNIKEKSAERLAGYFAIKEAAYKAINSIFKEQISFLFFCKSIEIVKNQNNAPVLKFNWESIKSSIPNRSFMFFISMTHTKSIATAIVICVNAYNDSQHFELKI